MRARAANSVLTLRPSTAFLNPLNPTHPPPRLARITRRPFLSTPLTPESQILHASRTLSYPASKLFSLISDISSYSSFLPYCTSSDITRWSSPSEKTNKKYPREAILKVGWSGYDETFRSKVYCVPDSVIEAVSGTARPTIPPDELSHYNGSDSASSPTSLDAPAVEDNPLFSSLLSTWTLREFPYKPAPAPAPDDQVHPLQDSKQGGPPVAQTEVDLRIEVTFKNPMYAALSKAVAPKVAGLLIEAFEKRAKEVFGEYHGQRPGQRQRDSAIEGVIPGKGIQERP